MKQFIHKDGEIYKLCSFTGELDRKVYDLLGSRAANSLHWDLMAIEWSYRVGLSDLANAWLDMVVHRCLNFHYAPGIDGNFCYSIGDRLIQSKGIGDVVAYQAVLDVLRDNDWSTLTPTD